jgi:hypothetical protein
VRQGPPGTPRAARRRAAVAAPADRWCRGRRRRDPAERGAAGRPRWMQRVGHRRRGRVESTASPFAGLDHGRLAALGLLVLAAAVAGASWIVANRPAVCHRGRPHRGGVRRASGHRALRGPAAVVPVVIGGLLAVSGKAMANAASSAAANAGANGLTAGALPAARSPQSRTRWPSWTCSRRWAGSCCSPCGRRAYRRTVRPRPCRRDDAGGPGAGHQGRPRWPHTAVRADPQPDRHLRARRAAVGRGPAGWSPAGQAREAGLDAETVLSVVRAALRGPGPPDGDGGVSRGCS